MHVEKIRPVDDPPITIQITLTKAELDEVVRWIGSHNIREYREDGPKPKFGSMATYNLWNALDDINDGFS